MKGPLDKRGVHGVTEDDLDREKPPIMRQDHDCTDECDKYIKQVQGLFAAYCETHGVEEPPGQRCEYFVRHPAKTESSLDLPERLRALARYDARDLGREGDEQFIHASTEWQAADEVERLRAIVEAVKQEMRLRYGYNSNPNRNVGMEAQHGGEWVSWIGLAKIMFPETFK